jgi:hypothetical protein
MPDFTGSDGTALVPFTAARATSVPVGTNSTPWTSALRRSGSPSRRSICRRSPTS